MSEALAATRLPSVLPSRPMRVTRDVAANPEPTPEKLSPEAVADLLDPLLSGVKPWMSPQQALASIAARAPRRCDEVGRQPDAAQARQQAMDLLRERTQPRPDMVEHNGLITDVAGQRGGVAVDAWQTDRDHEWQAYHRPEIQLESGVRAPAWSKTIVSVKEIAIGSDDYTRPVSGKADEMLCVRLPGDPTTGKFKVYFGASDGPQFLPITFARQGDAYYAVVISAQDYKDAQFLVTAKSVTAR